jgi:hypothetical protein
MAIMAMTTSNSIRVKAVVAGFFRSGRFIRLGLICGLEYALTY